MSELSAFLDLSSFPRGNSVSEPFLDDDHDPHSPLHQEQDLVENYSTSSLVNEMASTSISLPSDDLGGNPPTLTLTVDEVYQVQVRDPSTEPPHFAEPAPAPKSHSFLNPLRSHEFDAKKSLIRQRSSNQSFDLGEPSSLHTIGGTSSLHPRKIFRQRSRSNPDLTSSASFMSFLNLTPQGSNEISEGYLDDHDQVGYFEYHQDLHFPGESENFATYPSDFGGISAPHDPALETQINQVHRGQQPLQTQPPLPVPLVTEATPAMSQTHPDTSENGKKSAKSGNPNTKRTTQSKDPAIKARVSAMRKERSPESEAYKKLQATTSFLPVQVTPDNHLFQFTDQEKPAISRKRSNSLPNVYGDAYPSPPVMQPMIATNAYDANGVLQPVFLPMQNQPYFFPQASMPVYYPVPAQTNIFRKLIPKPQNSTAPLRSNRTWTFEMETGLNGKKSSKSS